jgi:hypothetical protein
MKLHAKLAIGKDLYGFKSYKLNKHYRKILVDEIPYNFGEIS